MPRDSPDNTTPLDDAKNAFSCTTLPVSHPFNMSGLDTESPENKRGTCESSESLPEDILGVATVTPPITTFVLPSTGPNRKKSRVMCNSSEPSSPNQHHFEESHQVVEQIPSVLTGSCVASSSCSDEDDLSPIPLVNGPFERTDLEEVHTPVEAPRTCVSPNSNGKKKSNDEALHHQPHSCFPVTLEDSREKVVNPRENCSLGWEKEASAFSAFSPSDTGDAYYPQPPEEKLYKASVNVPCQLEPHDTEVTTHNKDTSTQHKVLPVETPFTDDAKDFSNLKNLPPVRENEIEFVIENFSKYRKDFSTSDRLWSPSKVYKSVSFRLLVFPRGNKTIRLSNLSAYLAVDPSDAFPPPFKSMWYMHHYVDRGWLDFVPQEALVNYVAKIALLGRNENETYLVLSKVLVEGQFLGPEGQLVLRAQICPRVVAAGNQHFLSKQDVGYLGIRNQGATCYLNSLVQALYHIGEFRRSIFELTKDGDRHFAENMLNQTASDEPKTKNFQEVSHHATAEENDISSPWTEAEIREAFQDSCDTSVTNSKTDGDANRLRVSLALQELFLKLSLSNEVVSTDDLIRSFGWESNESLTQHDAQELNRLLCDRLEEQMKGTPSEGAIERLFMGEFENYVQCIDVPYSSTRRETFYDLQLDVQNSQDLYESLNKYVEEEVLEGDNLYDAENYGRQRARKGVRFIRFPPVVQFHLKRFTFDPMRMDMVKINQRFEYPQTLDLSLVLPGAGLYELFCVIVHGGDVGGGHYYVINRPGGKDWWMRFDDEKVYFVSRDSAFEDSYGGKNSVCFDYINDAHDTRYKSIDMSIRLHSAYILFYVRADRAKEILKEPHPSEVNPHLLARVEWEEKNRQKRIDIRNYVRNTVLVRYITEHSLRGYTGFLNDYSSLPACYERRFSQSMTVVDLWKKIECQVEKGELNDPLLLEMRPAHYFGLWFFDAALNSASPNEPDIRPLPLHLGECSKHESTLGDYLSRLSRMLRKPWAPTLCFLIHPIFSKRKSDIRSVASLQTAIQTTKFFIAKIFSPGPPDDPYSSRQSLVVAGIPLLKVSNHWRGAHPLLALFIEFLRTFLDTTKTRIFEQDDIEEFIRKAIKTYLPTESNTNSLDEDPLGIMERVYLESGHSFQRFFPENPASVIEALELMRGRRADESFAPTIVFALLPSPKALELQKEAYAYGVPPNDPDIYEEDPDYEESRFVLRRHPADEPLLSNGLLPSNKFHSRQLKHPDHAARLDLGCHSPVKKITSLNTTTLNFCDTDSIRNQKSEDGVTTEDASCLMSSALVAAPRYPPKVPFFPSCTPEEWQISLRNSKVILSLRLYDPLAVVGLWEDSSGHPLTGSMGDGISSRTVVEPTSPSSQISSFKKRLGRCPSLKEVDVRVDFRWPYTLALRWLCWHLGVNADYCIIQPFAPLSVNDCPAFHTHLAPSEADYLASLYTWSSERSEYILNELSPVQQKQVIPGNPAIRLEDLHKYFTQRCCTSYVRDSPATTKGSNNIIIPYHICLLPRRVTDATLGFMQSQFIKTGNPVLPLDDGCRLIVVKVFNKNVQNVGAVLVEVNKYSPPKVSEFIQKVKESFTPVMESRGAIKSLTYRLVWEGPFHVGGYKTGHQIYWPPSRLDLLSDESFAFRFPTLTRGFQFASPLRVEPDFTEQEAHTLLLQKSLPPPMTIVEQITANRTLCITIVHQNRDHQFFGHPFFVLICSSDTLRVIKEKIQKLLNIPSLEFSKWKFFSFDFEHTSFIRDDEVPDFSRGKPCCLLAVHKCLYAPEEKTRAPQLHIK